jgi:outer membrane murein-binding lipoprotein Lpp
VTTIAPAHSASGSNAGSHHGAAKVDGKVVELEAMVAELKAQLEAANDELAGAQLEAEDMKDRADALQQVRCCVFH